MRATTIHLLGVMALSTALGACTDSTSATGTARMTMQSASQRDSTPSGPTAGDSRTLTIGSDVLVISKVELVLRKIELEGVRSATCENDDLESGGASTSSAECAEVTAGPVLFDVPLGVGATQQLSVTIPAGSYHELHFQIHKLTGRPADQAFLSAHPDLSNTSVRVTGTFNGAAFVFMTDLEVSQNIELGTPLVANASGTTALTLYVDVSKWFVNAGGTALLDPSLALSGQPLKATVDNNIRASFHAFRDENHDGASDD